MSKKLIKKFQTPLRLHTLKQGGKLIPKHAKGSPVNNNPLPEMPVNTNPIPKKEDKKIENLGIMPIPNFITWPRGNTKGYFKMNPYKN